MLMRTRYESNSLTAGVAVEGKVVLGAGGKTSDLVPQRKSSKAGRKGGRGLLALET